MFVEKIEDSNLGFQTKEFDDPELRLGARGVISNGRKIGVFHKKNINQYKLPGGGVDLNETPKDAFVREVYEETGCKVKNVEFVGITNELKSQSNFVQTSYVFFADFESQETELHLTEKEIIEGGEFLWLDADEALNLMEGSYANLKDGVNENVYAQFFIVSRDTAILRRYKEWLKKK